jgi:hypothetical protein
VVTPPSLSQDNSSQGNSNYRQAADDGEGDGSAGADWAGDPAHTGFGDDWVRNRPYALGANQSAGVHIDSIQINAAGIDKNKIGEAVGKSVQDKIDSFTARADAFSNIRRQVRGRAD